MSNLYNGDPNSFSYIWEKGYEFKLGQYLNKGIEIFKANWVNFVLYTLILISINAIPNILNENLGSVVQIVLGGPLAAGFYIVARKVSRNEPTEFGDFFKGFEDFVQLLIGNFVYSIFVVLGLLFLLVPGIYIAVAYSIWIPFVIFHKLNFWDALETTRKIVTKEWWNFLLMVLVAFGIIMLGIIALGVGILAAIPIVSCMFYAAYEDIVDKDLPMEEQIDEIGVEIDEVKDFDDV